jgi:1-pyrroline-4-hydroxy-2-carboxylate deaminase
MMMSGRWDEARELYRWFTPLAHLDVGIKFVQCIKLAIQEAGLGAEWVRDPRLELEGAERERVLRIIQQGLENRPQLG